VTIPLLIMLNSFVSVRSPLLFYAANYSYTFSNVV